jgi:hypothetical protein
MGKCPHRKECKHYDVDSSPCFIGGQDFCGIYKDWETRKKEVMP